MYLDKIFNIKVLITINLAIIVLAESTGTFFLETGLIHIIALLFLILGITRIFVHYNTFDRYLKPLTWATVLSLVIFAVSHLTEYVSFNGLGEPYSHDLYVDVTNLYMTAMLVVALGAQFFLARRDKKWNLFNGLSVALFLSTAFTLVGFLRMYNVSIEPHEPDIYIYSVIVALATAVSINRLLKVGRAVSIVRDFAIYISIAFGFVLLAALQYSLYEVLEHAGMQDYKIIYLGHYLFYIALTILFLAFPKLIQKGGIYPKQ